MLCNDLGVWDEGGGEEGPRGRGCVCTELVHFVVKQKVTQYCQAIIFK